MLCQVIISTDCIGLNSPGHPQDNILTIRTISISRSEFKLKYGVYIFSLKLHHQREEIALCQLPHAFQAINSHLYWNRQSTHCSDPHPRPYTFVFESRVVFYQSLWRCHEISCDFASYLEWYLIRENIIDISRISAAIAVISWDKWTRLCHVEGF